MGGRTGCEHRSRISPPASGNPNRTSLVAAGHLAGDAQNGNSDSVLSPIGRQNADGSSANPHGKSDGEFAGDRADSTAPQLECSGSPGSGSRIAQAQVVSPHAPNAPRSPVAARDLYALGFGLFLGLALLKFGNPVILDDKISPPTSFSEAWGSPWPAQWGNWLLALLALGGVWLAVSMKLCWQASRCFWVLPMI